ncbi:MAG: hypothetical protein ACC641_11200 [Acidiferrobacterales bacterium]
MATIKQVGVNFLRRRAEIDALDQALARERRVIQIEAFDGGRKMTSEEKDRRREIGATRLELSEALEVLALTTLENLNDADDVDALNLEITRINEMLKDDLKHLKKLETYADTAADVLKGLAKAARSASKIVL